MTTTTDLPLVCCDSVAELDRGRIEDFLYHEANLLDDWRLDEWLTLFALDARYVVPCNDAPDADPARDLVLIDHNLFRLTSWVERLNSRKAHREYPHSNTSHQVTNVRLGEVNDADLPVSAAFTVWRFRNDTTRYYVGRYHYRLTTVDGRLRIRSKRVQLAMTALRPAADVAIVL